MWTLYCNSRMRLFAVTLLASAACAAPLFAPASFAQRTPTSPQPFTDGAAFTLSYDNVLKLNADKTGEYVETRRIKVLGLAALRQVAQQTLQYVEGMQSLEITAAFTEKSDGTKVPVDPATVITRDAQPAWAPSICGISRSSRSSSRVLRSATPWC
jgi:Domain of Unknown Function with PDB structure (DUF3857)